MEIAPAKSDDIKCQLFDLIEMLRKKKGKESKEIDVLSLELNTMNIKCDSMLKAEVILLEKKHNEMYNKYSNILTEHIKNKNYVSFSKILNGISFPLNRFLENTTVYIFCLFFYSILTLHCCILQ